MNLRRQHPKMHRKKGSKILKLLSVRNCFTLVMTNKLVAIINTHKVPKIKKILLHEMKFLVPNNSCLQKPWLEGCRPQIPVLSVLNWICWPPHPPKKIPEYATVWKHFSAAPNSSYKLPSLCAAADKFYALLGQTISLKSRNGVLT